MDPTEIDERPKPGKVMFKKGEAALIGRNLLSRKLTVALRREELIHIQGQALLNGSFGVGKGDFLELLEGDTEALEILRWIMNLTATNTITYDLDGDIKALPYVGQWKCIVGGRILQRLLEILGLAWLGCAKRIRGGVGSNGDSTGSHCSCNSQHEASRVTGGGDRVVRGLARVVRFIN